MRGVGRKQEHAAFGDEYVFEGFRGGGIDDFQEHGALVLVEPFWGRVDMVIGAGVGPPYDLVVDLLAEKVTGELGEEDLPLRSYRRCKHSSC